MSNQPIQFSERKTGELKTSRRGPSSIWSERLTYPQKFVLIALIFTLPLIAFLPLVFEQSTYIERYGHKEAQGNIYLRSLWNLTNDLQTLQIDISEYAKDTTQFTVVEKTQAEIDGDFQDLDRIHQQYGNSLGLDPDINEIKNQWTNLKENIKNQSGTENTADLISSIIRLTRKIGDSSYLILDPDLDTYYMMDTVLLKQPENQMLLFQIYIIADEIIYTQTSTPEKEAELSTLLDRLTTNLNAVDGNIQTATKNNSSGAMQPLIGTSWQSYFNSSLSFLNFIKTNLQDDRLPQVSSENLKSAYLDTLQTANRFYDGASQALEVGIQSRIARLSTRLYTVSAIAVISVLIALISGLFTMRAISNPLLELISATKRLAAGEMTTRVQITRNDEVGQVARSFNLMAQELQVEQNAVETRSHELETARQQSEQRARQLQGVAEVARAATATQELSRLLNQLTSLISQQFGYYHTGIFLLDEKNQYANLEASNTDGGLKMISRGHRLKIGEQGIIGFVTARGEPRIALDVGKNASSFDNPDLPDTRSELALPLKIGETIIGVLDLQSIEENAFNQEDVSVLSILADQVAITIQNARSAEQAQRALREAEIASSRLIGQAWKGYAERNPSRGYRYDGIKPERLTDVNKSSKDNDTLIVPVQLRGQIIGRLKLKASDAARNWTEDERAIIESTAERVAIAMEGARLLEEAQKRATRESFLSDIGTKLGASFQLDSILRDTVEELGQTLNGSTVSFQLVNPSAPPIADDSKPDGVSARRKKSE